MLCSSSCTHHSTAVVNLSGCFLLTVGLLTLESSSFRFRIQLPNTHVEEYRRETSDVLCKPLAMIHPDWAISLARCRQVYYRKRGSASYIVREWLLWVVERERETPVTSSMSRWNREWSCIWLPRQRVDPMHMHTRRRVLSLHLRSSAQSAWQAKTTNSNSCDRAVAQVKYRSTYPNNLGEGTASTEEISKKGIKLILKTIGNRKGDCAWSCSRGQTQPEKICKLQSTNQ